MRADIEAYEQGNTAPLEWLVMHGQPRDDEQVLDAARHVLALIEKDVVTAKSYVPILIQAAKEGGPIPESIHSFLAQA